MNKRRISSRIVKSWNFHLNFSVLLLYSLNSSVIELKIFWPALTGATNY